MNHSADFAADEEIENTFLRHLGFDAYLASAYVHCFNETAFHFAIDTHVVIIASINEEDYLVDVGWGDSYQCPVQLEKGKYYSDRSGQYRIVAADAQKFLMESFISGKWYPQYSFAKLESKLSQFYETLEVVYSHPNHEAHRQINCIKPTGTGFFSLKKDQFQISDNNHIQTIPVSSQNDIARILRNSFNMSSDFIGQYFPEVY